MSQGLSLPLLSRLCCNFFWDDFMIWKTICSFQIFKKKIVLLTVGGSWKFKIFDVFGASASANIQFLDSCEQSEPLVTASRASRSWAQTRAAPGPTGLSVLVLHQKLKQNSCLELFNNSLWLEVFVYEKVDYRLRIELFWQWFLFVDCCLLSKPLAQSQVPLLLMFEAWVVRDVWRLYFKVK